MLVKIKKNKILNNVNKNVKKLVLLEEKYRKQKKKLKNIENEIIEIYKDINTSTKIVTENSKKDRIFNVILFEEVDNID